jgi:hypothetical protein
VAFSARYTLALLNLVRLMMVDTVALSGLQVSTSMMVLTAASSVSIGLAHDLPPPIKWAGALRLSFARLRSDFES